MPKREIQIDRWNRKQHFEHFSQLQDPTFGVTIPFDVTNAYSSAKQSNRSFFVQYLHACLRAINAVDNFRYRIVDGKVFDFETIHASATISRADNTFGFSWISFDEDIAIFEANFMAEKERIQNNHELYPPINGYDCIHCSAMPWFTFTGHKEPVSGQVESIPQISFSKAEKKGETLVMNVAINTNHALVDGYHVGLFAEHFQRFLNN